MNKLKQIPNTNKRIQLSPAGSHLGWKKKLFITGAGAILAYPQITEAVDSLRLPGVGFRLAITGNIASAGFDYTKNGLNYFSGQLAETLSYTYDDIDWPKLTTDIGIATASSHIVYSNWNRIRTASKGWNIARARRRAKKLVNAAKKSFFFQHSQNDPEKKSKENEIISSIHYPLLNTTNPLLFNHNLTYQNEAILSRQEAFKGELSILENSLVSQTKEKIIDETRQCLVEQKLSTEETDNIINILADNNNTSHRKLLFKYHPDKAKINGLRPQQATDIFQIIQNFRESLLNLKEKETSSKTRLITIANQEDLAIDHADFTRFHAAPDTNKTIQNLERDDLLTSINERNICSDIIYDKTQIRSELSNSTEKDNFFSSQERQELTLKSKNTNQLSLTKKKNTKPTENKSWSWAKPNGNWIKENLAASIIINGTIFYMTKKAKDDAEQALVVVKQERDTAISERDQIQSEIVSLEEELVMLDDLLANKNSQIANLVNQLNTRITKQDSFNAQKIADSHQDQLIQIEEKLRKEKQNHQQTRRKYEILQQQLTNQEQQIAQWINKICQLDLDHPNLKQVIVRIQELIHKPPTTIERYFDQVNEELRQSPQNELEKPQQNTPFGENLETIKKIDIQSLKGLFPKWDYSVERQIQQATTYHQVVAARHDLIERQISENLQQLQVVNLEKTGLSKVQNNWKAATVVTSSVGLLATIALIGKVKKLNRTNDNYRRGYEDVKEELKELRGAMKELLTQIYERGNKT